MLPPIFTRLLVGLALIAPGYLFSAPGDLDTGFVTTIDHSTAPGSQSVEAMAIQPDGKILIAGNFDEISGTSRQGLARLNSDGTLDSSFSPSVNGSVSTIFIQHTGQILIAGNFSSVNGTPRSYIARLETDGSLDLSFDVSLNGSVNAIANLNYYGIILGGTFTQVNGEPQNYIALLDYGGALYTTFAPSPDGPVRAIQPFYDRIYISGDFDYVGPYARDAYASLFSDGTLDHSLSITGVAATSLMVIDPDGRLLVQNGTSLARIFGGTDPGFSPSLSFTVKSVALQANGSMFVTGTGGNIVRLNPDGTLDSSFTATTGGTFDTVGCCALQPDGQLLLGGNLTSGGTRIVQRLQNTPATESLTASAQSIRWTHAGTAPAVTIPSAFAEISTDGGVTWAFHRYADSADVENTLRIANLGGLSDNTQIRVRAFVAGGNGSGSSSLLGSTLPPFTYRAPEIDIKGNGVSIVSGDTSPSLTDDTDFGVATLAGVVLASSFTIENTGPGPLTVGAIAFPNVIPFTVSGITLPATIPSNSSVSFTVTYTPWTAGGEETTMSIWNDDGDENVYSIRLKATAYPEINITGNDLDIVRGDSTPSSDDGTDFGQPSPGGYVDRFFTIENTGAATLSINSITRSGHAADFLRTFPGGVPPGETVSFMIRFGPTATGVRAATVSVNTNDADEGSYTFAIRGEAYTEIDVQGNGNSIQDGSTIPVEINATDFGVIDVNGGQKVVTYTIRNPSSFPLNVTGITPSGTHSGDFTVGGLTVPTTVAAGSDKTFTVTFDPSDLGDRTATITVTNTDPDEASYDFAVHGKGAARFASSTDVPFSSNGVSISGGEIPFILDHAPLPGAQLKVIDNTGLGFITGHYSNLEHSDEIALSYHGIDYYFVANYYGGDGNDLVLQWANTKLYTWGATANGRLGDAFTIPAVTNKTSPVAVISSGVLAEKRILTVASGGMHTLALLSDGNVAAWGMDTSGQLGNDSAKTDSPVPVLVDKSASSALYNKKVVAIAAGYNFSLALCSDNTLVAWGENGSGQLGFNNTVDQPLPVAVKTSSSSPSSALAGKTVVRIAAGPAAYHSLALCTDNVTGAASLVAWGRNTARCLGHNVNVASVAYPVEVVETGALVNQNILAMAPGTDFSMVLCSDKTSGASSIAVWGDNSVGRLGNGLTGTPGVTDSFVPVNVSISSLLATTPPTPAMYITAIAAGANHGMALRNDGKVITWGSNASGKLGTNTAATTTFRTAPTLVSTSASSPASALYNRTVLRISAGENHCYAFCRDEPASGQSASFFMTSWGENALGQLGQGNTTAKIFPGAVVNGTILAGHRLASVSSGFDHSVTLVAEPDMADSDNDGLPDFWEIFYGLNPNDSTGVNGAAGDGEPDGQTNLTEYANNTPPNVANVNPNPGGGSGDPQTPNPSDFVLSFDHPEAYLIYEEQKNGSGVFVPSTAAVENYLNVATYYSGTGIPAISSLKAGNLFPAWHDTSPTWESPVDSLLLNLDHQNINLNGTSLRNYQWWKARLRLKSDSNLPQGCKVNFLRLRTSTQPPLATVTTALDVVSFSIPKNGKISPELPLPHRTEPPQPSWSSSRSVETRLSLIQSFINNQGNPYKNYNESLGVSNYVTTDGLPPTSLYDDVCDDPKNFRLQALIIDPAMTTVQMTLEVVRAGTVVRTHTYQLDQKNGATIRGRFLRLVTDTADDAASDAGATSDPHDQTILVKLGDTLRSRYEISPGLNVEDEIQVGRPVKEDNNDPVKPWKHDVRDVNVRFVVFGTSASAADIDQEIETLDERFAQCGVRVNVVERVMGVSLPAAFTTIRGGFTPGGGPITVPNSDEQEALNYLDNDNNTVDFLYVPNLNDGVSTVRGSAYNGHRNATSNSRFQNFVLVGPTRGELTVAHELLHILLNLPHRMTGGVWQDPATSLFHGTNTKAVNGTKRIGPNPDAQATVGNNDTTTVRTTAEQLP